MSRRKPWQAVGNVRARPTTIGRTCRPDGIARQKKRRKPQGSPRAFFGTWSFCRIFYHARNVLFFLNYANSVKIVIRYNISIPLERLKKRKKRCGIRAKTKERGNAAARRGRSGNAGPDTAENGFFLTHAALRFMTSLSVVRLQNGTPRKGGRAA